MEVLAAAAVATEADLAPALPRILAPTRTSAAFLPKALVLSLASAVVSFTEEEPSNRSDLVVALAAVPV